MALTRAQYVQYANEIARAELGLPGLFRVTSAGNIVLDPAFRGTIGLLYNLNLRQLASTVGADMAGGIVTVATVIANALKEELRNDKALAAANKELARQMHIGLRAQYGQAVKKVRNTPPGSYRRKNRYARKLENALNRDDMVQGSAAGIRYINQDILNAEARHWRRLNYGVLPNAGKSPEQFPITFQGLRSGSGSKQVGTIGAVSRPRPPMFLPAGFWFTPGSRTGWRDRNWRGSEGRRKPKAIRSGYDRRTIAGTVEVASYAVYGRRHSTQAFRPLDRPTRFRTRGVVAANFIDGGFKALAKNIDRVYLDLAATWQEQGERNARSRAVRRFVSEFKADMNLRRVYQRRYPGRSILKY